MDAFLREHQDYLELRAPAGAAREVAAVYRALAARCIGQHIARVLVAPIDADTATEHALRSALVAMLLAGIPSGFRLALIAKDPAIEARYRTLRHDLRYLAIAMEFFVREDDARRWLQEPQRFAA